MSLLVAPSWKISTVLCSDFQKSMLRSMLAPSGWPHACPQQIATVPAKKKTDFRSCCHHRVPSLSTRQGFTSWCFGCGYWDLSNHRKFSRNLSLGTKTLHKNLSKGSTPGVYHTSRQRSGNCGCPYLPSRSKSCNSAEKKKGFQILVFVACSCLPMLLWAACCFWTSHFYGFWPEKEEILMLKFFRPGSGGHVFAPNLWRSSWDNMFNFSR